MGEWNVSQDPPLNPQDLAEILRPLLPPDERSTLDSLLSIAVRNESICDICYNAARHELTAEQRKLLTDLSDWISAESSGFGTAGPLLDRVQQQLGEPPRVHEPGATANFPPVLGYCSHGVNLDTDLCPQGCRV